MDVYLILLCAGFGGLLLMSLLGLSHHHGGGARGGLKGGHGPGHANGHGHSHGGGLKGGQFARGANANANAHSHSQGHGHAAGVKSAKTQHASGKGNRSASLLVTLVSPRVIFGLLLGFGAAGVLLHPLAAHWPGFVLPLLAALCAFGLEWYVVQPFWNVLFNFASAPAKTLDSIVLEEGQAVTNFDASGHGLIAVDLDGQVRQLLGSLVPEERASHAVQRVRAGERLFIRAIDAQRNSCTVSRLN